MTTEAEAREVLLKTSSELLKDITYEIDTTLPSAEEYNRHPLTGTEIDDLLKKLYRITGTLKTAQSLSPM